MTKLKQKKKKVIVGDEILVEQAWEDGSGAYHDEYAKILNINEDGTMELDFYDASPKIKEFLSGAEFKTEDYEPI